MTGWIGVSVLLSTDANGFGVSVFIDASVPSAVSRFVVASILPVDDSL